MYMFLKRCLQKIQKIMVTTFLVKAPYNWRHAALDDVKNFLEAEVRAGRFTPQFEGGLDI